MKELAMKQGKQGFLLVILFGLLSVAAPAGAQTLSVTNGLALWLKADSLTNSLSDGQAVSAWNDSSGSGNHTSQGTASFQPSFHTNLFAGAPGVRFDGADDFLGLTRVALSSGLSFFAVFRTTSADATSGYPGNAPLNLIGDHTGQINVGFGVSGGFARYNYFADFAWHNLTGTIVVNNGLAQLTDVTHSTAGAINLFARGNLELSTNLTYNTTTTGFDRISGGFTFSPAGGTADFFDGDVAEILVYGIALSESDRLNVEAYLDGKYSLGIPEPSSMAFLGLGGILWAWRRRK